MNKQTTLAKSISCTGTGLHSGREVRLSLSPAPANAGIVFKRTDVNALESLVPARYDLVSETRLGTTIRNRFGVSVSTIEHLMAALWGAGVDNAVVSLNAPEVPIMDGSSEPFMRLIAQAGVKTLSAPRKILKLLKTVEIREGASVARVMPNVEGEEGCVLAVEIEFASNVIKRQAAVYDFRNVGFGEALSRARTFGFEHEVEAMRKAGLALGGSLQNAVVVGKEGVLNEEGLRFDDEFVRHKALDCLGDLYLAGCRIDGRFEFSRPGHAVNNALLRAVFADETAYTIVRSSAGVPMFPALPEAAEAFA